MTITPTGTWRRGQTGDATVTFVGGPWPVYTVTFDIPNDAAPAWQVSTTTDVRPTLTVTLGPFRVAQTTTLRGWTSDARGCGAEATIPIVILP